MAYDAEVLQGLVPWIERARDVASRYVAAGELEQVREGLENAVCDAAALRADALATADEERLDALLRGSQLLSPNGNAVVVVIVDPLSPDVPSALCARPWPISIELASTLAADLREEAPDTADWLTAPIEADEHRVIVFTLGRFMRTTRKIPSYADA